MGIGPDWNNIFQYCHFSNDTDFLAYNSTR